MLKKFVRKQWENLKTIAQPRANLILFAAIALFVLLNVLKITIFNQNIIPKPTADTFKYKFEMTLLLVLVVYPIFFLLKSRVFLISMYVLQVLYIAINISYYQYFHTYLNINQALALFKEGFTATANASAPITPFLLISLIDLPVLIFLIVKYHKIYDFLKKLRVFTLAVVVLCVGLITGIEINNYYQNCSFIQYAEDHYNGESPVVERYGTFINNIIGIYNNRSDNALIKQIQYGKEIACTAEQSDKPNYVIIQVESMDANVINKQYNGNYIAPYLHSLTTKSVYYPYMLSYHMGGGTSDSEFSIINSIQPLTGYPAIKMSNYEYPNSMIKQMRTAGYEALAFHGNVGNFFNRDVAFPRMGFNEFVDMRKMGLTDVGWGAPDSQVFDYTAKTLNNTNEPFFSYVITMTSHGPFTNVTNYFDSKKYDSVENETVKNYLNSMTYVDKSIEKFVTDIQKEHKNTYIFIWGDHTPNIKTTEYMQASLTEGENYFEFVPLFIITPDNKVYKEDKKVASFLDIAPTILNTSGIKYNIKSNGLNLLNDSQTGGTLPYKGGTFDRVELFKKISQIN